MDGFAEASTTIIRDGLDEIPLLIPDAEGVWIKVLKADEDQQRVVVKARFEPGGCMPRHTHHCRAVAYTLSGEWEYDAGTFGPGDIAYEAVGEVHQPRSQAGTEMILVFDSPDGRWLDNHLSDGRTMRVGMPFFKALERISLARAAGLELGDIVEFLPGGDGRV